MFLYSKTLAGIAFGLMASALAANAQSLAIVNADPGDVPIAQMLATGDFTSVVSIDAASSTPTLAQLSGYNDVLAYTNFTPANATALGNVLDQYYALGGTHLTIATYGFSNPWAVAGTVSTGADSALTNVGVNGSVSGNLVATVPTDPVFNGINLATFSYFNNINFAHPGLAPGATLLATDGAGVDMIARSADGVVDVNLFPGSSVGNSQQVYQLLANTFSPATSVTPEPSYLALGAVGMVGLFFMRRRRRPVEATK
jgi:MYXO-CTERM domain-containing protein